MLTTSTTSSEPWRTRSVGPGTEPLYAIIRTVSSPIRLATAAIRSSNVSPSARSTTCVGAASGRPALSVEKVAVALAASW